MVKRQFTLAIVAVLTILTLLADAQSWLEPTFYLYTLANRGSNEVLKYNSVSDILASHFNGALPTKMITHGYFDSSTRGEWMAEMANKMLDYEGMKKTFFENILI